MKEIKRLILELEQLQQADEQHRIIEKARKKYKSFFRTINNTGKSSLFSTLFN